MASVLPRENKKVKYLDPHAQSDEYIDRGNIVITEALYGTQDRVRVDKKSQLYELTLKKEKLQIIIYSMAMSE